MVMAKIKKDNSANPFVIDEGVYTAVVQDVEEKQGKKGKDYLRWTFQIKDPTRDEEVIDENITLSGNTPGNLQDDSKLDKWLKACGVNVEDQDTVDTSDAEGAVVKVLVENNEVGDKTYSNVIKIKATKKGKKKPEPEEEEEEEEKPAKKSSKKKSKKKASKPKEEPEEEEPEEPEEEEEEEKPAKKSSKKSKSDDDIWDFD